MKCMGLKKISRNKTLHCRSTVFYLKSLEHVDKPTYYSPVAIGMDELKKIPEKNI